MHRYLSTGLLIALIGGCANERAPEIKWHVSEVAQAEPQPTEKRSPPSANDELDWLFTPPVSRAIPDDMMPRDPRFRYYTVAEDGKLFANDWARSGLPELDWPAVTNITVLKEQHANARPELKQFRDEMSALTGPYRRGELGPDRRVWFAALPGSSFIDEPSIGLAFQVPPEDSGITEVRYEVPELPGSPVFRLFHWGGGVKVRIHSIEPFFPNLKHCISPEIILPDRVIKPPEVCARIPRRSASGFHDENNPHPTSRHY